MRERTSLLTIGGFFGLLAAANAQTLTRGPAVTTFDGTYRVVSSTRANQMYTSYNGQMGMCPDRKPGSLHIMGGRAHYMTGSGYRLGGTVGPQGELRLSSVMVVSSRPAHLQASGTIDPSGTARIHQMGSSCSYDFVWQKRS